MRHILVLIASLFFASVSGQTLIKNSPKIVGAMKIYFEKDNLSIDELGYAYKKDVLKESIEKLLLDLKIEKEIISPEEEKKWEVLFKKSMQENSDILAQELTTTDLYPLPSTSIISPVKYSTGPSP